VIGWGQTLSQTQVSEHISPKGSFCRCNKILGPQTNQNYIPLCNAFLFIPPEMESKVLNWIELKMFIVPFVKYTIQNNKFLKYDNRVSSKHKIDTWTGECKMVQKIMWLRFLAEWSNVTIEMSLAIKVHMISNWYISCKLCENEVLQILLILRISKFSSITVHCEVFFLVFFSSVILSAKLFLKTLMERFPSNISCCN